MSPPTSADTPALESPAAVVGELVPSTTVDPNGELAHPMAYPADRNPAAVYVASLAPGSRRTVRGRLDLLAALAGEAFDAETLPWHLLRYQHTQALRARVAEKYAPATANAMLSALRGVLKEAWRLGHMDAESYQRAQDLRHVPGERLSTGRALTEAEVERLFAACPTETVRGLRDRALIALLFGAGLRRSEACSARFEKYQRATGRVRIVGKGNKEREVPLGRYKAPLEAWVDARGTEPGPLLVRLTPARRRIADDATTIREEGGLCRGENGELAPLTTDGVYKILAELAGTAGLGHVAPHDGRRTRLTGLFVANVDALQVQRFAGHRQLSTTARYDLRGGEHLARAIEEADRATAPVPDVPEASRGAPDAAGTERPSRR